MAAGDSQAPSCSPQPCRPQPGISEVSPRAGPPGPGRQPCTERGEGTAPTLWSHQPTRGASTPHTQAVGSTRQRKAKCCQGRVLRVGHPGGCGVPEGGDPDRGTQRGAAHLQSFPEKLRPFEGQGGRFSVWVGARPVYPRREGVDPRPWCLPWNSPFHSRCLTDVAQGEVPCAEAWQGQPGPRTPMFQPVQSWPSGIRPVPESCPAWASGILHHLCSCSPISLRGPVGGSETTDAAVPTLVCCNGTTWCAAMALSSDSQQGWARVPRPRWASPRITGQGRGFVTDLYSMFLARHIQTAHPEHSRWICSDSRPVANTPRIQSWRLRVCGDETHTGLNSVERPV